MNARLQQRTQKRPGDHPGLFDYQLALDGISGDGTASRSRRSSRRYLSRPHLMLLLPDFAQLVHAPPYSKSTKPAQD